jgi:hypothetical protein
MDKSCFDMLARLLANSSSRRKLFSALVVAVSMATVGSRVTLAAGCKKVGQKCDKNGDCCNGAECKGSKCKCKIGRNECGGKCYKLDSDEKRCGACDASCATGETCCDGTCADLATDVGNCGSCGAACAESEACVAGGCGPQPFECPADAAFCSLEGPVYVCGGSGTNCSCMPTTEGAIRCGDLTTEGTLCGQCQSSTDCVGLGFGADAFCAKSRADCCGPDADNICLRPCPA